MERIERLRQELHAGRTGYEEALQTRRIQGPLIGDRLAALVLSYVPGAGHEKAVHVLGQMYEIAWTYTLAKNTIAGFERKRDELARLELEIQEALSSGTTSADRS